MSFDDFQALFEVEGDLSSKKMKITSPDSADYTSKLDFGLDGSLTFQKVCEPEIVVTQVRTQEESDVRKSGNRVLPETPTVVLRHKPRSHRRLPPSDGQFGLLSPIPTAPVQSAGRPLSSEYPGIDNVTEYSM